MINEKIIREYDIRGIYGKTLTERDAFLTGWSFGQYIHRNFPDMRNFTVNVCRDGRFSSESLSKELMRGLAASGIAINDIGLGPTPMLYFSSFFGNALAGIMVTGSHNPAEYNGFKFILDKQPFFGEQIKELQRISCRFLASDHVTDKKTKFSKSDFSNKYVDMLLNIYPRNSGLKVVWDPGNGAAANIITKLCKKLPGEHIVINSEVDGSFPSHHPDPTVPENLTQLIDEVKAKSYDIGIAFDGDGDRIGIVDKNGRIVWGDQLMILFARDVLKTNPGAYIIADVKASNTLFEEIQKCGGVPVISKTGHSNIKEKMHELDALIAGEMSGHIFFADKYFGYDDAPYASVRLIDILSRSPLAFHEMLETLPVAYNTPEIRLDCPDEIKFKVIEEIKSLLKQKKIPFLDLDGIRYSDENGWWLLRASNTQGVLVCRFEASSKQGIDDQKKLVSELLEKYKIFLPQTSYII
jgi:phosphomannomutase